VAFDIACGACWFCDHGQSQLCDRLRVLGGGVFGGGLAGTQAEFVRVPVAGTNLLPLPEAIDDESGLFVGDVLATATASAALADPAPDEVVAVLGCGPVGCLVIQSLRARGIDRILAFDRTPGRLALAEAAGAEVVDIDARNPQMAAAAVTDDRGADVVVECVGHPDAFESATEVVRRGGRVVVAGMYAGETLEVQLGAWWARALDLRFVGMCPVHSWWERGVEDLLAGRVDPAGLVSHRLTLDEAPEGYRAFGAHEAMKVVLRP
jgi:alcohol dehydrogenase